MCDVLTSVMERKKQDQVMQFLRGLNEEYNSNSISVPVYSSVCSISALSCNKISIDLWHFWLGHPSFERLLFSKQLYPILTSDKHFICETCHHSK